MINEYQFYIITRKDGQPNCNAAFHEFHIRQYEVFNELFEILDTKGVNNEQ